MASTSYMPAALGPFLVWLDNFYNIVSDGPTGYGLTAGQMTTLNTLRGTFSTALTTSTTPSTRTPVTVAATNEAFIAVRANCQALVEQSQASLLPTEEMLVSAGMTVRKTTKSPIVAPTATPSLDIQSSTSLAITLRSKELGALNNAIPTGCVGYQVWCILDPAAPPSTPDNFVLLGQGTRRFYTQNFDGSAVGKQCYYAIRYITARQLVGPWSNIVGSTVVST